MVLNWKFGKEKNEVKKFSFFYANFPDGTEFPIGPPITENDAAEFGQTVDDLIRSGYLDLDRMMSRYEASSSKEEFFQFIQLAEKIVEQCNEWKEKGLPEEEIDIVKDNLGIVDSITLYENLKEKWNDKFISDLTKNEN